MVCLERALRRDPRDDDRDEVGEAIDRILAAKRDGTG
jgi:hypothetical protein